jgi:hypothetical protein
MARPATGTVLERQRARGTVYALRFRVDGRRVFETLGTEPEGWTHERAQEALKDRLAQARLGLYQAPSAPVRTVEKGRAHLPRVRLRLV